MRPAVVYRGEPPTTVCSLGHEETPINAIEDYRRANRASARSIERWLAATSNETAVADVLQYALGHGHRTRPTSAYLAAGLFTDYPETDLVDRFAVAIELAHKASVIHDDIMDSSVDRSGRPTVHETFGTSRALAASDVMLARSFKLAGSVGLLSEMVSVFSTMSEGQARDVSPEAHIGLRFAFETNDFKTASLASFSLEGAAVLVGASVRERSRLGRYGLYVGRAFQLVNDFHEFLPQRSSLRPAGEESRLGRQSPLHVMAQEYAIAQGLMSTSALGLGNVGGASFAELQSIVVSAGFRASLTEYISDVLTEARLSISEFTGRTGYGALLLAISSYESVLEVNF